MYVYMYYFMSGLHMYSYVNYNHKSQLTVLEQACVHNCV